MDGATGLVTEHVVTVMAQAGAPLVGPRSAAALAAEEAAEGEEAEEKGGGKKGAAASAATAASSAGGSSKKEDAAVWKRHLTSWQQLAKPNGSDASGSGSGRGAALNGLVDGYGEG